MCVPVSESMQNKTWRGEGALTLLLFGGNFFKQRNIYSMCCILFYQSKLRVLIVQDSPQHWVLADLA